MEFSRPEHPQRKNIHNYFPFPTLEQITQRKIAQRTVIKIKKEEFYQIVDNDENYSNFIKQQYNVASIPRSINLKDLRKEVNITISHINDWKSTFRKVFEHFLIEDLKFSPYGLVNEIETFQPYKINNKLDAYGRFYYAGRIGDVQTMLSTTRFIRETLFQYMPESALDYFWIEIIRKTLREPHYHYDEAFYEKILVCGTSEFAFQYAMVNGSLALTRVLLHILKPDMPNNDISGFFRWENLGVLARRYQVIFVFNNVSVSEQIRILRINSGFIAPYVQDSNLCAAVDNIYKATGRGDGDNIDNIIRGDVLMSRSEESNDVAVQVEGSYDSDYDGEIVEELEYQGESEDDEEIVEDLENPRSNPENPEFGDIETTKAIIESLLKKISTYLR